MKADWVKKVVERVGGSWLSGREEWMNVMDEYQVYPSKLEDLPSSRGLSFFSSLSTPLCSARPHQRKKITTTPPTTTQEACKVALGFCCARIWCRALVRVCWGSLQRWRRDRRARRRRRRRGRAGQAAGERCRDRTRLGRRPRGRDRQVWGGGGQRHQGAEEEGEGSAEGTTATCCVSTRTMRPDSRSRPPSYLWWASASSASWPPSMSSASFTTTDPVALQLKNEVYIFHLTKHFSFSARAAVSSTLWKGEREKERLS